MHFVFWKGNKHELQSQGIFWQQLTWQVAVAEREATYHYPRGKGAGGGMR